MKRKPQQYQTPAKKSPQIGKSPSPNSNSFSHIFEAFYPRTPVRKVNTQQQQKDQLGQLMEKGISKYCVASQVTFNSMSQIEPEECDFKQFQIFDRKYKPAQQDWTLLNQKQIQPHTNKTQLFITLQSAYKKYRENTNAYLLVSTANFLALFSYNKDEQYSLFMDREKQSCKSPFLENRQIESVVLGVEKPLATLFPANFQNFPTKYTLSLVRNKQIQMLFNAILNVGLELDSIDLGSNYVFHNSYCNSIVTCKGYDNEDFALTNQNEYKIQFEGLFTVEQILDIKKELAIKHKDVVVSDIKLNSVATLISCELLRKIDELINQ